MGAWGTGIFEDDVALDLLDDLSEKNNLLEEMSIAFKKVIESNYLEYEEGINALVFAAIIDQITNQTKYDILQEEYEEVISNIDQENIKDLTPLAFDALNRIISNESELNVLWQENQEDYAKWKSNIVEIMTRLH